MKESAADRLGHVLDRIEKAARRGGRNPQDVVLVAVTKTISLDRVLPFIQAGIRHIGENRVQEALLKYENADGLKSVEATLHLIGQLQSNKVKKAIGLFDVIQSLDRIALADDISRHAQAMGKSVPCLIEVKISPESSKSGVDPGRLEDFLAELKSRSSLVVKGLMGVAPLTRSAEEARPFFRQLRQLYEKARLEVLSMGMSADFEVAVEEGSTMVRLGTALFGARS